MSVYYRTCESDKCLSKYILALFRVLELSIRCRISASECRLNLPNLVAYGYPMSHQHRHHQKTYIRHLYTPPLQSPPLVVAAMIKTQATMSTHKGVNQCSKDVTQTQQQRPESPTVTLMEFMYLVFTRTPDESYRRRVTSVFVVVFV